MVIQEEFITNGPPAESTKVVIPYGKLLFPTSAGLHADQDDKTKTKFFLDFQLFFKVIDFFLHMSYVCQIECLVPQSIQFCNQSSGHEVS